MPNLPLAETVRKIRQYDSRFSPTAYEFIRQCLDHSIQRLGRSGDKKPAHVRGGELLEGFRGLALREFGPMAKTVLNEWGIQNCSHVGEIVFQLVQHGILGQSETDRPDDFQEIWTFTEAFETPFQPKAPSLKAPSVVWRAPSPKKASPRRNRKPGSQAGSGKL
ncbi:MAG: hypothetical protein NTZ01_08610 [Verrucomicrobia bacterium]|nr:hypothetical protein [Verrucomicrobiota bacterium]